MPWNLVSCWSSSDSAPVSTRVSPSAIVPRRKRLLALIASLAEGGRTSVDIAQIPPFASQPIQCVGPKYLLQRGVHVLRHRVGVATHVDRRTLLHPREQLASCIQQGVLHVALLRLIA